MKKTTKPGYFLILPFILIFSLLLTGCGSPAENSEAVDADVEEIQNTETETSMPTDTSTPEPSNTPEPTETLIPPTVTPTATITSTFTATVPALSAEMLYVAPYPNKYVFDPNETFGVAIGFKNTGSQSWKPGGVLLLVSYDGEPTVQTEVELGKEVLPGESIEFNLWAFGSEWVDRTHTWYFSFFDASGQYVEGASAAFTYEAYNIWADE